MRDHVLAAALAAVVWIAASPPPAAAMDARSRARKVALEHHKKAEKAFASRNFDAAEGELRAALEADPQCPPALMSLGQTYMVTKRYGEALDRFLACKQALLATSAERQREESDLEAAREEKIASLKEQLSDLGSGRLRVGNLAQATAQIEQQIRQLEEQRRRNLVNTDPVPPALWLSIGSAHFRLGQKEDARAAFERAIAGDPKLGEAHNNLAVLDMMDGRLDEAQRKMEMAERNGFAVHPAFKDDLAARRSRR